MKRIQSWLALLIKLSNTTRAGFGNHFVQASSGDWDLTTIITDEKITL